ncbi:vitamin K epoxide reductase family protein [Candidatus Nomurabacteria bacterium]|nr:vitamin K epoxide reductase family protein [Candidatus Nomurabacteria bacterium]
MIFSEDVLIRTAIFVLASCGFLVAKHIYKHKKANQKPLVCPIRFDCNAVVHSDYSKLFGVPLEVFGMLYYCLISFSYLFLVFMPSAMPAFLINLLIGLSCFAFLFSVYLISVQIFILKKGCSWCIVSAFISMIIFILTITHYHVSDVLGLFN